MITVLSNSANSKAASGTESGPASSAGSGSQSESVSSSTKRKVELEDGGNRYSASSLQSKRNKLSPSRSPSPFTTSQSSVSASSAETNTFTSRMLVQLAKSAATYLETTRATSNNNGVTSNQQTVKSAFSDSPVDSLTNTILLPRSDPKCVSTQNLALIISTLTSEVSKFDVKNAFPLIHAILRINWIRHSFENVNFSQSYATFLVVLVSTIPSWWGEVANKIVGDFTKEDPEKLNSHHQTLKRLISLSPTSSNYLPKLLKSNFPNKTAPKEKIVNYVKNILSVSEYYSVLTNYVWSLVIENFIKLDVEFQNQIDDIDDDDLADALGLEESDNESENDNSDPESDSEDGENDAISDYDDDDDDDDNDVDAIDGVNVKTVDDELADSDAESETGAKTSKKSKVIKRVKFADEENAKLDRASKEKAEQFSDEEEEQQEEDFDEDMLDSEAEYSIELETVGELSKKIDSLLKAILEYLKPKLSVESLEAGQGIPIFNALIKAFNTIIVPTHGSKATQYIIFYAAQQQPELIDAFLVSLFEIVFSTGDLKNESLLSNTTSRNIGSVNKKITGIQYISSFVARASKMSDLQIASVVTFLVDYCTAYMEEHLDDDDDDEAMVTVGDRSSSSRSNSNNNTFQPIKRAFNPTKHSLFYSLVQALMYIICFRKDSLRESDEDEGTNKVVLKSTSVNKGTGWVAALDKFFTRVIISKYDPLRWCNETVVLIFSRVAQSEGICYTWSVVERIRRERVGRVNNTSNFSSNNTTSASTSTSDSNDRSNYRASTPTSSASSNISVGTTQSSMRATQEFLDSVAFFPFDPLLLQQSKKIVESTYVEWSSADDDDDDDDNDDDDNVNDN